MKVIQTAVYEGPNIHAPVPAIHLRIDLGELEEWPTGRLGPAFTEALLDHLPGLGRHGGSEGAPGSFAGAMAEKDGVSLAEVLAHAVLELQRLGGLDVEFAEARPAGGPGIYDVVYGYEEAVVGMAAGQLALASIGHLLPSELRPEAGVPPDFDFARARDAFVRFAIERSLNYNTVPMVKAAEERGIPWTRLGTNPLIIQLGHGRFQKRILHTMTSDDSVIAMRIATDKMLTVRVLDRLGLPVPRHRSVASEQEAVRAAEGIGYPVVVKPVASHRGKGVGVRLADAEEVRAAFARARRYGARVLVEGFIEGDDHRLLVVDGELIAAANRVPAHVTGDGVHTVEELMEEVNRDPRRGIGPANLLVRLELDEETQRLLAGSGYTGKTVPAKGETVALRHTANMAAGGTAIDVTDQVHPDNRIMAIQAAEAVGLVVAGVDFITPDIGRSHKDVGGAICEVNWAPAVTPHLGADGKVRDVAGPIIDTLYPPGSPSRIPIAAVTGGPGATAAASMLAHVLETAGQTVGLATREGLAIDGDRRLTGDRSGPAGARSVLHNPSVDAAVLETSPEGVLRRGLGFDICDVAAVLDAAAAAPGNPDSPIPADMLAKAMEVIVRAARGAVVLDADDELCLAMADQAEAGHVCYVTMDPGHPLLDEHLAAGGRAVVLEKGEGGGTITVRDGDERIAVVATDRIPALRDKRYDALSAMFAAAMAHALGKTADQIREGLCTFERTAASG
jgi:cyanophycin synthetase